MNNLKEIDVNSIVWKSIKDEQLDLEYAVAIPKRVASRIMTELEDTLEYFTGDLSKIKVYGKVYPLPRQQVAYGDPGITYKYSGTTVPALPWPAPVLALRDFLTNLKGLKYDFVLVNRFIIWTYVQQTYYVVIRIYCVINQAYGLEFLFIIIYRNGCDHMGEHRDNEPELDPNYPIASISLGQERPFVLKHKDATKPGKDKRPIPPIKIDLEHGSVLLMNPPTNEIWYHSLPTRKKLLSARINLTFRKMRKI